MLDANPLHCTFKLSELGTTYLLYLPTGSDSEILALCARKLEHLQIIGTFQHITKKIFEYTFPKIKTMKLKNLGEMNAESQKKLIRKCYSSLQVLHIEEFNIDYRELAATGERK